MKITSAKNALKVVQGKNISPAQNLAESAREKGRNKSTAHDSVDLREEQAKQESSTQNLGMSVRKNDLPMRPAEAPSKATSYKAGKISPTPDHAPPQTTREAFKLQQREATSHRSRYIHSTVRHAVWTRDEGCCTHLDPRTDERCQSRHFPEYDHITPFAMGGENTVENLRLRCRSHNAWHAIQMYGTEVLKYVRF